MYYLCLQMMSHIVNHLNHFPMGTGASRLGSSVSEFHDTPHSTLDDLRPEIFNAPNVQVGDGWITQLVLVFVILLTFIRNLHCG